MVQYLVGDPEPYAETIRKMLHTGWIAANTGKRPTIASGYHKDGAAYTTGDPALTPNDWTALGKDDIIRLHDGASVRESPENWARGTQRHIATVYIDVISYDSATAGLYAAEIDRIILDSVPDTSTRLPKSDGSDSAITTFDRLAIDWTVLAAIPKGRRYYQLSGELGCLWQS